VASGQFLAGRRKPPRFRFVQLPRDRPRSLSCFPNRMPRGARQPSAVFRTVLQDAKQEVLLGSSKAAAFVHKGIRGDERAASLAKFLRERLPERFGVGKGEVIDYLDHRTGQLDLVVYDKASSSPISTQNENLLLPCEALYMAIEVKTKVTQAELDTSLKAASRLRALRPFKARFVAPRRDGAAADDGNHRCMYVIFGYTSDLGNDSNWLTKEQKRIHSAAGEARVSLDCVDRVIVLDRGIINPAASVGKWGRRQRRIHLS
jgi:uncharacterized protein DUF6602